MRFACADQGVGRVGRRGVDRGLCVLARTQFSTQRSACRRGEALTVPTAVMRAREGTVRSLGGRTVDLLVIGGGIIGAGIARDAALRGLSIALVEQDDFASGTTSRPTRLIHGGLRYLELFDFALVRSDMREREILLRIAAYLVRPLPFLLPIYRRSPIFRAKLWTDRKSTRLN